MVAVTPDPAEGLVEATPTPRNVEARGNGFSFSVPALSGGFSAPVLSAADGAKNHHQEREKGKFFLHRYIFSRNSY